MIDKVDSWNIDFNAKYIIRKLSYALKNRLISQGKLTLEFEKKLSKTVGLPYAVCTNSGSSAFLLLLITLNLKKGDEIIIPDRTWISDLHAPKILGLKIKLVDVEDERPVINLQALTKKITKKTKVIVAVHLGGRLVNINQVMKIAKKRNIIIIEDSSQVFGTKNKNFGLGRNSLASFFSFSVAKIVSSGQGGFIATKSRSLYKKLILNRSHGVKLENNREKWSNVAFNFKFTDIQACLGIGELIKINEKKKKLQRIYNKYFNEIKNLAHIKIIPINLKIDEVPLYIDVVTKYRKKLFDYLKKKNIQTRPFYPSMSEAKYNKTKGNFRNSIYFSNNGLFLPSGPDLKMDKINKVIRTLKEFEAKIK